MKQPTGTLVLLGAPLGNPGDASARLASQLATADVIAAEDTRRLKRLLADLHVETNARIVSYFEGNEARRTPELLELLREGTHLVLITDGGMPSVSDPGYRLVRAAIDAQIAVTAVPGPSAVTTALALSGLPCDRFSFEGFVPRKAGERTRLFTELAEEPRTMVFFESPRRIISTVADMGKAFGADRPVALCRELTKTYEEVRRGTIGEVLSGVEAQPPLGEITLVVAGWEGPDASEATSENLALEVERLEADGMPRKDAMKLVASKFGLSRRDVYGAVLAQKSTDSQLPGCGCALLTAGKVGRWCRDLGRNAS
ncbi:16S rRNA (cytidine(1402)-2'-O)-methyltransferase [Natronoglycomyces albus]|uniref:Ribosomal RNA small subunit methyltransferase I n=1 Tax=Natronoglycomyces albus TaxID=2811108 RepID=A0A895XUW0_9ACTN|nr:16S rRNA (cytidine(1402)-2'-O)-methyltransferase [Natronoglycomyces albus]